jgi:hypothetical protein
MTSFSHLPCYISPSYTEWLGHGGSSRIVVAALRCRFDHCVVVTVLFGYISVSEARSQE